MTGGHGCSSSQESEFLDDATFNELNNKLTDMGIPLEPMMQGEDIVTDEKPDMMFLDPPQHMNIPVLDEFGGQFDFAITLNIQGTGKSCVYSQQLQKIFIDMEQTLPLRFEWRPHIANLFLRTTMVFSHDQSRSDPVVRCHNHMAPNNAGNNSINPAILKHVVRCLDPKSLYEERHGHLSVAVPLGVPQAGSDYVPINYQFFCKNSCTSGMNRRPTELVFTLENANGEVLGRRKLCVRVCSCPKRDKEKEENERQTGKVRVSSAKKRKLAPPPGKKLLVQSVTDTREYTVNFKIPGRENYLAVIKQTFDLLAGQAFRTGQQEYLRPYMDDLLQKLNN